MITSGTLAISSEVAVDIYDGDTLVGSTPITLHVSPGTHTFEYRHQNMVKRLLHVITSDKTTAVSVTFDITVRINARPWANVFLEGNEMKLLGETPLSQVTVPLGSVLVFRNPSFPDKRHRVTTTDVSIQAVFP